MRRSESSTSSRAVSSPERTSSPARCGAEQQVVVGHGLPRPLPTLKAVSATVHRYRWAILAVGLAAQSGDLRAAPGPAVARPGPARGLRALPPAGRPALLQRLARHRDDADPVGRAGRPHRRAAGARGRPDRHRRWRSSRRPRADLPGAAARRPGRAGMFGASATGRQRPRGHGLVRSPRARHGARRAADGRAARRRDRRLDAAAAGGRRRPARGAARPGGRLRPAALAPPVLDARGAAADDAAALARTSRTRCATGGSGASPAAARCWSSPSAACWASSSFSCTTSGAGRRPRRPRRSAAIQIAGAFVRDRRSAGVSDRLERRIAPPAPARRGRRGTARRRRGRWRGAPATSCARAAGRRASSP